MPQSGLSSNARPDGLEVSIIRQCFNSEVLGFSF